MSVRGTDRGGSISDGKRRRALIIVPLALPATLLAAALPVPAGAGAPTATKSAAPVQVFLYSATAPRTLKALKRNGVLTRVGCSRRCVVVARMLLDAQSQARYGLPRQVGRAARQVGGPKARRLRVRIKPRYRARITGGVSYRIRVRAFGLDPAGS